jgi:CubicO group peptidase (beta-lactamase class C family)
LVRRVRFRTSGTHSTAAVTTTTSAEQPHRAAVLGGDLEGGDHGVGERGGQDDGHHLHDGRRIRDRGHNGAKPVRPAGGFGHSGSGGSTAFADPAHRFSFALVKNRMTVPGLDARLASEIRTALGIASD